MNIDKIKEDVQANFTNYMDNVEGRLGFLDKAVGITHTAKEKYNDFLNKFPDMQEVLSSYKNKGIMNANNNNAGINFDLSILKLKDEIDSRKEIYKPTNKSTNKNNI